jgi:hypothetical protein
MEPLLFLPEVPDTGLAWLFYALLGAFIVVILVGSLTERGKNASPPEAGNETRRSLRKPDKSTAIKRLKK